jgi:hypothetical protein
MEILDESQAEALRGGWFAITVSPSIVITNAFQTNAGASIAIGVLGASALAGLSQGSLLSLFTSSR